MELEPTGEQIAQFFPLWLIVLDYSLGVVMWTLIGRAAMNLFLPEDSSFFFMRVFVKFTDPVIRAFKVVTPSFLVRPLVPFYVAWFFFMVRFYVIPWAVGYSVFGMLSFPLEGDIAAAIYQIYERLAG